MSNVYPFPGQGDQDAITLNFFEKVLPPHGLYCACAKKRGGGMEQTFHETIESLWTTLKEADRAGRETYFAPASFSSNDRTTEACAERRSLEIDIDFGAGHARPGYATAEEAKDALKEFCEAVPMPMPMVSKSGGGFHVWWTFKEALSRAKWQRYADGLKAACLKHGLRADHSLTINPVHILRAPGTMNRKLPAPRPVELDAEWLQYGPYDWPDELLAYAADNVVRLRSTAKMPPRPLHLGAYEPSEAFPDLYEPVKAAALADNCGQYGRFRTTGRLPEPVWNRLIAGMLFVEDGEAIVHLWSSTDPRYQRAETQGKFERAKRLTGPPLCKGFLEDFDPETRAICMACPLLGTITTPLQGVEEATPEGEPAPSVALQPSQDPELISKKAPYVEWDLGEKGIKRPTFKNAAIALGKLELVCKHDVFHLKKSVNGDPLDDTIARSVRETIIARFRFDPGKLNIGEALERECERNEFDPVAEYLRGLRWDGLGRLDRWLSSYLGAKDNPLNRAFGRKTLLAAIRRVFHPGCKFDQMLVLEGPQGAGKSTAWKILASEENFSDAGVKWDDARQQRETAGGVWIHEVAELVGLRKADVEAIKSFLSRQNDRTRAAYDHFTSDQLRRCIFVGTINATGNGYLTDPTGARRFWPVEVGRINLARLKEDRDQIWAEAVHYEGKSEALELPPELYQAAAEQQDLRRVADPWFDILAQVPGDQVSSNDIMMRDLGMTKDRLSPIDASRVASIMRRLGWDGPKVIRIEGKVVRGYERTVA